MYHKLDEQRKQIRLLIIHGAERDGAIDCTITFTYLEHTFTDSYETISYVWGDTSCRGSISVDGHTLDVPISTEEVLQRVRYTDFDRVVWIDSVFINHQDLDERASQVSIMNEIYGRTARNLIWLGPDPQNISDRALISVAAIIKDIKLETDDFKSYTLKLYDTWGRWQMSSTDTTQDVDWDAFFKLMESPWFTRLWVLQEAALSPENTCLFGQAETPLQNILRAACWATHKSLTIPDLVDSDNRGVKLAVAISMYADKEYGRRCILHNRGVKATTLSLLTGCASNFDASDERDFVFGMTGLYRKFI